MVKSSRLIPRRVCVERQPFHWSQPNNSWDDELHRVLGGPNISYEDRSKTTKKAKTHITIQRILDSEEYTKDFYTQNLAWSESGILAIALNNKVYFTNSTGKVLEQTEFSVNSNCTSLTWINNNTLAIGTVIGQTFIYNTDSEEFITMFENGDSSIGCLSQRNEHIFTTGSYSGDIVSYDMRCEKRISKMFVAADKITGLAWKDRKLASGSNNNEVQVWDARKYESPSINLTDSKAAVKGLAWSPWQDNVLATGGGHDDRCLRLYNVNTGAVMRSLACKMQITSIMFGDNSSQQILVTGRCAQYYQSEDNFLLLKLQITVTESQTSSKSNEAEHYFCSETYDLSGHCIGVLRWISYVSEHGESQKGTITRGQVSVDVTNSLNKILLQKQ